MTDTETRSLIDIALDAAFPDLPDGMTMEEARRRVAKALVVVEPLIRSRVEAVVRDGIYEYGRSTGDLKTARAYDRAALGD